MTPFEILSVEPDASDAEIEQAFRHLARQLHPDAHPGASTAERARYQAAMADVNAAHDAIKNGGRRASPSAAHRTPNSSECEFCGSAPATVLQFSYQVGFLLWHQMIAGQASLCRDCGLAMGRSHQNKTLLTGWWGVVSFCANFGVILRNAVSLRRASRLPAPEKDVGVEAPLLTAATPGRPLFGRVGVWFAIALIGVIIAAGALVASNRSSRATFAVGACVSGTTGVGAVDCSEPNDGVIIGAVTSNDDCPADADGYVNDGAVVWCTRSS